MKHQITLMRHGEAVPFWAPGDLERPLTEKGKLDAQRIGAFLDSQGLRPDRIVSSPAQRCLHSAEKLHKVIWQDQRPEITLAPALYNAAPNDILSVISEQPEDNAHVLLVGHNPGIARVPALIADKKLRKKLISPSMQPASAITMEFKGTWQDIAWAEATLVQFHHARDVPQDFAWPDRDGTERRERPAYCYRQSAIIPYRYASDGNLEILMVGSRSGKNIVIPKGAIDPGLSAVESAMKEAVEEAGAMGTADSEQYGIYRYPKWGAICEVAVFAMRVDALQGETDWEESHRSRQWLDATSAINAAREVELQDILKRFVARKEAA